MVEAATNAQIKEIFERNERTVRSDRRKKTVGKAELWVTELDALLERIRTAEADKARLSEALRKIVVIIKAATGRRLPIIAQILDVADAALSGSGSGWPVPDGWKLVPVEPTEEMYRAAYKEQDDAAIHNYGASPTFDDYWSAALEASPAAPQQGGE